MCHSGDLLSFSGVMLYLHLSGPKINSSAGTVVLCSEATSLTVWVLARPVIQGDKLVDIVSVWQMGTVLCGFL